MLERLRRPLRRWPLRAAGAMTIIMLVIGVAIGVIGTQGEVERLRETNASLAQQLDDARAAGKKSADTAEARAVELERLRSQHMKVKARLDAIGDLESRKRSLSRRITELSARVREEQAKLTTVKAEVAKSSFGDGTWEMNVDFIPDTYQAPGGDACYWAKLKGPSGGGIENIIDNGGFNNRPVVTVDSPYFETRDCGTWRRVGD